MRAARALLSNLGSAAGGACQITEVPRAPTDPPWCSINYYTGKFDERRKTRFVINIITVTVEVESQQTKRITYIVSPQGRITLGEDTGIGVPVLYGYGSTGEGTSTTVLCVDKCVGIKSPSLYTCALALADEP